MLTPSKNYARDCNLCTKIVIATSIACVHVTSYLKKSEKFHRDPTFHESPHSKPQTIFSKSMEHLQWVRRTSAMTPCLWWIHRTILTLRVCGHARLASTLHFVWVACHLKFSAVSIQAICKWQPFWHCQIEIHINRHMFTAYISHSLRVIPTQ